MKCQTGWDTTPGLGWEPVLKQGPSLLASELTLDISPQSYKGSGPILLLLDWLNKSKPDQEVFTHNPKAREEDSSKQSSGRSSSFPSPPCAWWSFSQCPCWLVCVSSPWQKPAFSCWACLLLFAALKVYPLLPAALEMVSCLLNL